MYDKIIKIEECFDEKNTIDIELDGNHLFFANDILVHNSSSDPGLDDTSESFGLPATADFMFAAVTSEELEKVNQIQIKQLKNRDNDVTLHKRFVVGIDRSKMKLYDIAEQPADQAGPTPQDLYKTVGKAQPEKSLSSIAIEGFQRDKMKDKIRDLILD